MEDLISVVNKLQDTFSTIDGETVDLPQVVVVGSQSSGKSSVLENIVGRDFLPRGSGIVTRRPLILQLVHVEPPRSRASSLASPPTSTLAKSTPLPRDHAAAASSEGPSSSAAQQQQQFPAQPAIVEYGEFLHVPNRRFFSFVDIRKEIETETLRVAGSNKGISRLPIHLKIYSERVLNLTLVDLPGLTKIPVGDQPTDIERQIRSLVLDFISKPNCVILAISPANVDLANSDSLKLARSVDPQGRRTIGVLTKLDLMDAGTNALDVLTGRVYPLKLGFIGVVNRSQQDIISGEPMEAALEKEAEFFRSHAGYRNIAHRCGTKFLAKTLNQVLMSHIRDKLPDMKARLNTLMGQTQQELATYGDPSLFGPANRGALVLKLMTQFVRDFVSSIDGTQAEVSTKELCGGARIFYIFHDVFGSALESIHPMANLTEQDIRTAIRNSTGPRASLFVPEAAFDLLIKPQVKLLEPPGLRCVELVYEELMKICHNCTSSELQRYPRLHAQLIEVVSELLRERLGPTSDYVQSLMSIQTAYINTSHPAFVAATMAPPTAPAQPVKAIENRRPLSDGDADGSSDPDDEGPSSMAYSVPNGRPSSVPPDHAHARVRTASANTPLASDPRGGGGAGRATTGSGGVNGGLSSSFHPHHHHHSPQASSAYPAGSASVAGPSGTAKDTFLNYFFGGGQGTAGLPPGAGPASASGRGGGSSASGRRSGADVSLGSFEDAQHRRGSHAMAGRKGHEGTAAAFGMKSLEKHLEPSLAEDGYGLSEREQVEINLIRSLIEAYFAIVRQTYQDLVPKAVMHLLVNHVREGVQNRLVSSLYRDSLFEDLLQEDEGLTNERARIKGLLDAYKDAFRTLSEVL